MASREFDLRFPVGGLHRRFGFQHQPPYTTPDCLNVQPADPTTGRERGGSRPGIVKYQSGQVGSGNPVRLLTAMRTLNADGATTFTDTFSGSSLGGSWATYTDGNFTGAPTVTGGSVQTQNILGNEQNAARLITTDISNTGTITIDALCDFSEAGAAAGEMAILLFACMDNTTPVYTDGAYLQISRNSSGDGTFIIGAGSEINNGVFTGGSSASWVRFVINTDNSILFYWDNLSTPKASLTPASWTRPGRTAGFGLVQSVLGREPKIQDYSIQYTSFAGGLPPIAVMMSTNGILYRESVQGSLTAVNNDKALRTDTQLMTIERLGTLFMFDYGELEDGTDGATGTGGTDFTAASVADWGTLLSTTSTDNNYFAHYRLEITAGTNDVPGTYGISTFSGGTLTLASAANSGGLAISGATWRLVRAPKLWNTSATSTITNWTATTAGFMPMNCPIAALWRDRIVMAGDADAPHVWFMSRQGDPYDWNFGASITDSRRALAGTATVWGTAVTNFAGGIGQPITAIIPHSDAYLLIATSNSIYRFVGDPAAGGRIESVSNTIGVVDRFAWCHGPAGEIIFLSRDGVYLMPSGASEPTPVSRDKLPQDMINRTQTSLYQISLAYDVVEEGVRIMLTPRTAGPAVHYWMDWEYKSFWPVTYASTDYDPLMQAYLSPSDPAGECVLLGCRDGYLRKHSTAVDDDDGTDFTSYVDYGPFVMGERAGMDGMLMALYAGMGTSSGDVTWSARVGTTAEAGFNATASLSGTFSEGFNAWHRPRLRGNAGYIRLTGTGAGWSIERLAVQTAAFGPARKL